MKLGEALEQLDALSAKQIAKLASWRLCTPNRKLTDLGQRLLNRDESAATELAAILQPQLYYGPDWIVEPPSPKGGQVFGPACGCGDMAGHSLGF